MVLPDDTKVMLPTCHFSKWKKVHIGSLLWGQLFKVCHSSATEEAMAFPCCSPRKEDWERDCLGLAAMASS